MLKAQTDHELWTNQLLGALEPASRKRIDPHLEAVEFKLGEMVCDAGGLLEHAYFPQGSVLSLLTVLENGAAIETANIGREGAFASDVGGFDRGAVFEHRQEGENRTLRKIGVLEQAAGIADHLAELEFDRLKMGIYAL